MSKPWTLKRTTQCDKCPWKVTTNPHDIPDNYNPDKHRNLKGTIAERGAVEQVHEYLNQKPLRIMACHETDDAHCIGWLKHQLGVGNNIRMRIEMTHCTNGDQLETVGEQHATFEDTLPKDGHASH